MEIREERVYIFKFPYDNTEFTIPVRAESKEDAVKRLQSWMSNVQTELAMEFPQVSQAKKPETAPILPSNTAIPYEVLEMRIDTLLSDLGVHDAAKMPAEAKAKQVLLWTEFEYKPDNFIEIIKKLEMIATGQDDTTPKKKK